MKSIIYTLLVILVTTSCDKWLDIKPDTQLDEPDYLTNEMAAQEFLNGIYLQLLLPDLYGQEMTWGLVDALGQLYDVKKGDIDPHNYTPCISYNYESPVVKTTIDNIWKTYYVTIANVNTLLQKMVGIKHTFQNDTTYNVMRGELYSLRAFLHFDVYRLWGPMDYKNNKDVKCIPYYTSVSFTPFPLISAEKVMEHIENDINVAEQYLLSDLTIMNRNRYSMNFIALRALRARVALWKGDKTEAFDYANSILNGSYSRHADTRFPWATGAGTGMFPSEVLFAAYNSNLESIYKDNFAEDLKETVILAPRQFYYDKFFDSEPNDWRKVLWNPNPSTGPDVVLKKYQINKDDNDVFTNRLMPFIRKSEMVLILAETAKDTTIAYESLSKFYSHRIGEFQNGTIGTFIQRAGGFDQFIQKEYIREFYGEGQYFFFLKRKQAKEIGQQVDANENGTYSTLLKMGKAQYVWPLPDSELGAKN